MSTDLLPFLKLAPLMFTTVLRILSQSFYNHWGNIINAYSTSSALRGEFEQYTVFAFDWFQCKYVLSSSLLYTGLLSIYTSQIESTSQAKSELLILLGVILLGLSVFAVFLIDKWFNKKNFRPESYYRFYYRDGGYFNDPASEEVLEAVEDEFLSRHWSPPQVTLVSEVLLVLIAVWIIFGPV